MGLSSTLSSAKEQMEAAAKAAREGARTSMRSKSNTGSGRATNLGATQVQTSAGATENSADLRTSADSVQGTSAETDPAGATTTGSLFDVEVKADI